MATWTIRASTLDEVKSSIVTLIRERADKVRAEEIIARTKREEYSIQQRVRELKDLADFLERHVKVEAPANESSP